MTNDSDSIVEKKPTPELIAADTRINFEPKILALCCNWCAYGGATTAGALRIQYPPNIRIIRVMCSGRVAPHFILHAIEKGADGVIVIGCYPNYCKYILGFENCEKNIEMLQDYIDILGLNPVRIKIESVNVNEGNKFVKCITDFINEIKKLGPNPMNIFEEKE